MLYFTNASRTGRVLYHQLPSLIGVTDLPGSHKLIGSASKVGQTGDGQSLWSLASTMRTSLASSSSSMGSSCRLRIRKSDPIPCRALLRIADRKPI